MAKIIISYRRSDADMFAGRVRDRIAGHFGEDSVFIDVDNIPFGKDFRVHIQEEMAKADSVLVVIGPKWLGTGKGGRARIKDETDPVRIEVETALGNGIPTIPILVGNAKMPRPDQLPDSLRNFPFINAASVDTGRDFHRDVDRVIATIDAILVPPAQRLEEVAVASDLPEKTEDPSPAANAIATNLAEGHDADHAAPVAADREISDHDRSSSAAGSIREPMPQPRHQGTVSSSSSSSPSNRSSLLVAAAIIAVAIVAGLAWEFWPANDQTVSNPPGGQPAAASANASAQGQGQQPYGAVPPQQTYGAGPSARSTMPPPAPYRAAGSDPGAAVVSQFYNYLSTGDGDDAAKLIVPEKRTGNFSPQKMNEFYGGDFFAPLQLLSVVAYGQNTYQVSYTFQKSKTGPVCSDTVTVTVTQRSGQYLIQGIVAPLHGC